MPLIRGRNAPQNIFLETLANKFDGSISNFVLGNAQSVQDYPIVYCSDGFCQLTGFTRSEVMRKSCCCKFLFGIETEKDVISKLTQALQSQTEMKEEVLLYKKNGVPFWCLLDVMPIKNEKAEVVLFLVSHKDITKSKTLKGDDSHKDSVGNGSVPDAPVPRFRKFSRDVLLHIQRQYSGKTVSTGKRGSKFPSSATATVGESSSFIPQYKLENAKLPRFMILHFGRPRLIWDWIILILVCYIAIMVPFNVAFKAHDQRRQLIIADCIVEVFFIVDIVINFRTTYIDKKSGRIITQKKMIAMHYLKRWFIVDFLAALPFEALYFIDHSWGFLVSLLKTGRLLRLFRIARRISRYIEYTVALLGLLMFSFAMLGHWFACIWYVIGYEEFKRKEVNGWLYGLGDQMGKPYTNVSLDTGPSKAEAYISSLYFILTSLTTVGFGNIAPNTAAEKIFSVIVLLLGALMQSAIFGNMTAVIQKLYAVRARFHAKAAEIKQFVRLHRIENDLKRRIEDFFLTHWSVSKGVDSDEMLESFPSELRADICLHMYKNFLSIPCFSDASRGCWRLLSLKVKRAYFGPGELILKERDAIDAIFFVNSGTIEIVQKECIVAILGSGDLFGDDVSRRVPIRRSNGDVRALTYCDLLYLTRENFLGVVHLYPDFAESFSEKLEMTFNLGMRERELSTCGALDSITEGDEEEEEEECVTESAEDDNQEEISLLKDAASPPSPALPLWQQQLRSKERGLSNPMAVSPSLEERLMRIGNDSDTNSSEADGSEKAEYSYSADKEGWACRNNGGMDEFELNRRSSLTRSMTSICSGSRSVNTATDSMKEVRETSFCIDKLESVYPGGMRDGETTQVQVNYTIEDQKQPLVLHGFSIDSIKGSDYAATSQTMLIERDDEPVNIIDNPFIAKNYINGNSNEQLQIEQKDRGELTKNQLPMVRTCRNLTRHRYSLPELTGSRNSKYVAMNEKNPNDIQRSLSMSNPRRQTLGILRKSRLLNKKTGLFEPLPEDHAVSISEEGFDCRTDITTLSESQKISSEALWDALSSPNENGTHKSSKTLANGISQVADEDVTNGIPLPCHMLEKSNSDPFSKNHSDSDSDMDSRSGSLGRVSSVDSLPLSAKSAEVGEDLSKRVLDCNVSVISTKKRKSTAIDWKSNTTSSNMEVSYLSEMRHELTNEVRSTRKSVEGIGKALTSTSSGNGLLNIGLLAKDLTESKAAVNDVSIKIDRLNNDVIGLKKEVKSLTALVRLLIERQDSLR